MGRQFIIFNLAGLKILLPSHISGAAATTAATLSHHCTALLACRALFLPCATSTMVSLDLNSEL